MPYLEYFLTGVPFTRSAPKHIGLWPWISADNVVNFSNLLLISKYIAPPSPCCLRQTLRTRTHSRNFYFLYHLEPTQCLMPDLLCNNYPEVNTAHRFHWSLGIVLPQRSVLVSSSPEQACSESPAYASPAPLCLTLFSSFTLWLNAALPSLELVPWQTRQSITFTQIESHPSNSSQLIGGATWIFGE